MSRYYLGMISGTSVDGVDAALCEFSADQPGTPECRTLAAQTFAWPPAFARRIQSLITAGSGELNEIGSLNVATGRFFGDCALALIRSAGVAPADVRAIGSHGQTIWHQPNPPEAFTWQIGDPNSIAAITGIDTVSDLRGLDMALGGEGAPLVPAFHDWLFRDEEKTRVVVNIGGIANLTLLAPGRDTLGYDTGPGNTLLDAWVQRCLDLPFDDGGRWAGSGKVDTGLLDTMLAEPYFAKASPKSTGRELFDTDWLDRAIAGAQITDVNLAATLLELTAVTISNEVTGLAPGDHELFICGGGAHNDTLMARLSALAGVPAQTTAAIGLDPDHVEAAAMAWLARARVEKTTGNLPTVTGSREAAVLGGLYCGDHKQA